MNTLLPALPLDLLRDPGWQQFLPGTIQAFVALTLVAARLAGMMIIGPIFGHPALTVHMRILLVVATSLVLAPVVFVRGPAEAFSRLDRDGDLLLHLEEVAPSWQPSLRRCLVEAGKQEGDGLSAEEFRSSFPRPETLVDYACLGALELAIGLALGLGMTIVISACSLAGTLLDQQIGFSTAEFFNPDLGGSVGLNGQLLHQLGLIAFLIAGGHMLLISALLETFQVLPIGHAWLGPSVVETLSHLVQQSLALSIRIAAPVLGVMALVGLALGYLGRALPQLNVAAVGLPVRALVGLLIVGLSLESVGDLIQRGLPELVLPLREGWMGSGPPN